MSPEGKDAARLILGLLQGFKPVDFESIGV